MGVDVLFEDRAREAERVLAVARRERTSLPPREAARRAYTPGGPSLDEIEAAIDRYRRADRSGPWSRRRATGDAHPWTR
jgi:hypothetical protein